MIIFYTASDDICKIIISGGNASNTNIAEALVYQKEFLDLNVKKSNLILEPNSKNTFQNAQYTRLILKKENYDQIFLVTSGIHIKRSALYFSYFGIQTIAMPSDYMAPIFSFIPLAYNFAVTDFALHEYAGIMRFYLYNFFGWNSRSSTEPRPLGSVHEI